MSCFRVCDGDECGNTENDCLYHVSEEVRDFMKDFYPSWKYFNDASDLCDECIENINEEYPKDKPLLVVDDYSYVEISDEYKG